MVGFGTHFVFCPAWFSLPFSIYEQPAIAAAEQPVWPLVTTSREVSVCWEAERSSSSIVKFLEYRCLEVDPLPTEGQGRYRGHCRPLSLLSIQEQLRKHSIMLPARVIIF